MAVSLPAYTALEALLLFQCLKGFGVEPAAFSRAAELLQANPDIAAHRDYHRARLTPDALRAFYQDRLRAELDHDDHDHDHDNDNHSRDDHSAHPSLTPSPTNPRKRKAPASVSSPTQHQHLIPKLVDKLYATYRRDITDLIRADEARFDALQREIAALDHPSHPHPQAQPPVAAHNGPPYPHISPHPHAAQPRAAHSHSPAPRPPHGPHALHGPHTHPQPIQPYVAGAVNGPPQFPPPHHRFPHQQPLGPHSPGVQTPQQHKAYFPQHMGQPPPQAGFMLPPFQVSPQDPSRVHHPPVPPPQHPSASTPLHNRPQPASSKTAVQTPASTKPNLAPHPLVTQARHSLSTPSSTQSPTSTVGTPRSVRSVWKKKAGTPTTPRPEIESLDDFVPLVSTKPSPSKPKSQRKGRGRAKAKESEPDREADPAPDTPQPSGHPEEPAADSGTRQGRSRRKAPAKRTRPGSIASSRAGGSTRDRSRSQSILSHTETVADTESQAGNRIKSERGTSVDHMEDEAVETPSHMSTRRRGAAQAQLSTRRKRNAREASLADSEDQAATPGPPRTIIAHRNFPRTCQPIMDDIASHKHASIFTTAVRPKDAPGYYEVIKRPKDLSNIKKGIATGAKQVAAAASDTPIGSPGGAGGTIELPLTHDNIPPRAIVNPAQLEKELVHMFANAVMFNPGEEGVVEDAREMFETVQQSVSSWRNVGRSSGRLEIEDTPAAEDEEEVKPLKRRKV